MIALVLLLAAPAQVPANWACDDAAYGDGAVCDCGCDAPDSDCPDGEMVNCDTSSCPGDQAPWEHQSDQCMGGSCGDGWKSADEACDDFNALASGGCNADCSAVNEGFTCGDAALGCQAVAGGEGEGEGEAAEGEGEASEGEGEDGGGDDGGCAGTPAGLAVALAALLGRRRARAAA